MLDSKVALETLEGSEVVVVEPDYLKVGEMIKIDQNCGFEISQMHLGCLFCLLGILDGDCVPRICFDFCLDWLVLAEEMGHCLFHFQL
jgi:hypothetical protein